MKMQTWLRRILALVALVGSVYGLSAVYTNFAEQSIGNGSYLNMALAALGFVFFLFGIMCGFWLLERRTGSTIANVIFWIVQLPVLATGFISYKIFTLAYMNMTTTPKLASFGVTMSGPESNFLVALGESGEEQLLGLNMMALMMIVLLISVGISTRREKSLLSGVKTAASVAGGAATLAGAGVVATAKGAASVAGSAGDIAEGAVGLAKSTASAASEVAEMAVEAAKDTASTAGDITEKTLDTVGNTASALVDKAGEVAKSTSEAITTTSVPAIKEKTTDTTDTAQSLRKSTLDTDEQTVSTINKSKDGNDPVEAELVEEDLVEIITDTSSQND